jgi:Na+/glutamate symporter
VIAPGILILACGLLLCSRIEILTQFYIYYGVVVGTGIACIGIIGYSAILAHWFEEKRGLAFILAIVTFLLSCVFCWLAAPRKYRSQISEDRRYR